MVRANVVVQPMIFRFLKLLLLQLTCCGGLSLLVAAPPSWTAAGPGDSGAGPNGVNIGFDFNWNNGPAGYTASFIEFASCSGATLDDCAIGSLTATTSACDFAIAYSIGGVPQTAVVPGGVYSTWNGMCDIPTETAPLTLFNCFNSDSFGQLFLASATGTLSGGSRDRVRAASERRAAYWRGSLPRSGSGRGVRGSGRPQQVSRRRAG